MDLNESQFSPSSEAGMEFYRLHILGDTRIVSILEHTYKWCALGTTGGSKKIKATSSNSGAAAHTPTYSSSSYGTQNPIPHTSAVHTRLPQQY
ncbi:hypothetical protein PG995_004605 [Apiospora arundinis]